MEPLPTVVLVISTVVYIVVGASIVHVLEWPYEQDTQSRISHNLNRATQQFLGMVHVYIAY